MNENDRHEIGIEREISKVRDPQLQGQMREIYRALEPINVHRAKFGILSVICTINVWCFLSALEIIPAYHGINSVILPIFIVGLLCTLLGVNGICREILGSMFYYHKELLMMRDKRPLLEQHRRAAKEMQKYDHYWHELIEQILKA